MKLARTLSRVNTLVNINANGHLAHSGSQIGARLKTAREAAGLTQDEVAAKLGVHFVTVSRWETKGVNARGNTLLRLAALYGESVESLLGGEKTVREASRVSANVSRGTYAKSRQGPSLSNPAREFLAEFRLRLTKAGVTDEEIEQTEDLLRSPALSAFYHGDEAGVLRGMQAIAQSVVIPELLGRRTPEEAGARKLLASYRVPDEITALAEDAPAQEPPKLAAQPRAKTAKGKR